MYFITFTFMKKSRFSESQIVSILKKQEAGVKVSDICREHSISDATFYNWKAKYGGMSTSELKRVKELEAENARLKKMYAELSLVHHALKDVMEKKF
jgi:putative transposase